MKTVLILLTTLLCSNIQAAELTYQAVPGEYVVRLKSPRILKNDLATKLSLKSRLGEYIKSILPNQNIIVLKRASFEHPDSALTALQNNPLIDIAEPNFIYFANKSPRDFLFSELWGLKNSGHADYEGQPGLSGVDISAEKAWDIETGSKNVIVAIIDSGIDYKNIDLKENIWTNEAEANGTANLDDDGNGYIDDVHGYNFADDFGDPMDDYEHGTHCAGTIGARGDNGIGSVGVAWNVKMMALKFLSADGSGTLENAIKAVDYATRMQANILSNSWGGGAYSVLLKKSIEQSNVAGKLFVAAAGNESVNNDVNPTYPSSYDVENILSVAAIDNRAQIATFSNYGKSRVHVAAPGVQIFSTIPSGYESLSGTSMAAPYVSGIAALLASHEPNLSALDIKNRIITTTRPALSLKEKVSSGGIVNALAALTNDTSQPPDPYDPSNWNSAPLALSTVHPYEVNTTQFLTVQMPGAKQIAIYFSKFEVEAVFDNVEIFDAKGLRYQILNGEFSNGVYSTIIDGDTAKIILTSDTSVPMYGFDISKVSWR